MKNATVRKSAWVTLIFVAFLAPPSLLAQSKTPTACTTTKADLDAASIHTHFDQVANGSVTVIVSGTQKTVALQDAMDAVTGASKTLKDTGASSADCADAVALQDAMAKAARASVGILESAAKDEIGKADGPATAAHKSAIAAADKAYAETMGPSRKLDVDAKALAAKVEKAIGEARVKPMMR